MSGNAQAAPDLLPLHNFSGYEILRRMQAAGFQEAASALMPSFYHVRSVGYNLSMAWVSYERSQDRFFLPDGPKGRWFMAPRTLPKPKLKF
jgi:hypothetical protein